MKNYKVSRPRAKIGDVIVYHGRGLSSGDGRYRFRQVVVMEAIFRPYLENKWRYWFESEDEMPPESQERYGHKHYLTSITDGEVKANLTTGVDYINIINEPNKKA